MYIYDEPDRGGERKKTPAGRSILVRYRSNGTIRLTYFIGMIALKKIGPNRKQPEVM